MYAHFFQEHNQGIKQGLQVLVTQSDKLPAFFQDTGPVNHIRVQNVYSALETKHNFFMWVDILFLNLFGDQ
jgi:hypothetical protein